MARTTPHTTRQHRAPTTTMRTRAQTNSGQNSALAITDAPPTTAQQIAEAIATVAGWSAEAAAQLSLSHADILRGEPPQLHRFEAAGALAAQSVVIVQQHRLRVQTATESRERYEEEVRRAEAATVRVHEAFRVEREAAEAAAAAIARGRVEDAKRIVQEATDELEEVVTYRLRPRAHASPVRVFTLLLCLHSSLLQCHSLFHLSHIAHYRSRGRAQAHSLEHVSWAGVTADRVEASAGGSRRRSERLSTGRRRRRRVFATPGVDPTKTPECPSV